MTCSLTLTDTDTTNAIPYSTMLPNSKGGGRLYPVEWP